MLLQKTEHDSKFFSKLIKRSFDIFASSFGIVVLGLLIAFVYISKKLRGSDTPLFYTGERIGVGGKRFHCLKFTTMHNDGDKILAELLAKDEKAKEEWDNFHKLKNDPRIDGVLSQILRKTSLDEIPQIWNIFVGDMSLIGPRPIIPEQIKDYGEFFPYYTSIRPGLTGLWQVSGRNETSFKQRIYWDTWYIKNWSLWTDVVILFKTVMVVLTRRGAF